jgi:uncharacterized membrane protein
MTKTATETAGFDDVRMETIMGWLLQIGVFLASTVVAVGGLLYVVAHAHSRVNYRTFVSYPVQIFHPLALIRSVLTLDPLALIQFGTLLLVGTPIARVIFAVIGFTAERDRLYLAISLFVLAVLAFSLLHGA